MLEIYNNETDEISWLNVFLWIVILILGSIVFFSTIFFTSTGHKKVITRFGKVTDRVVTAGVNIKTPLIEDAIDFNIRTVALNFDDASDTNKTNLGKLGAASKDLQDVTVSGVVNYHLNDTAVLDIFKQYGTQENHENNVILPTVKETIKAVSSRYTAEELITKRTQFSDEVNKVLSERFSITYVIFEKFSVTNIDFSDAFTKAIEDKQVAQQQSFQAQYALDKSIKEAEAIKIQAEALKENPDLVQWEAVKKWNGVLPTTTGGVMPFLDISTK